jgi:ferrous iron transport protein A
MSGSLDELAVGAAAVVDGIEGAGAMFVRLLEMGFVPGTRVEIVKRAPFGDPLELKVRGYHVSLRREEARRIRMQAGAR